MLNIDFHTHVKLAKRVDFDLSFFYEMVLNAKDAGLTAFAMTEHFNTKHFYDLYGQLDRQFDYKGHYFDVDGFKVFTGMEIDVKEVGHILFIGHRADLLDIRHHLEHHTKKDAFISFPTLLDMGESYDLLMIGAHPLRKSTPLHHHDPALLERLHAFDLNGKDMFEFGVGKMQLEVRAFADQIGLPVVCGSDSHHPIQMGVVENMLQRDCETAGELRDVIVKKQYKRKISPILQTKVNAAKIVKRKMKDQYMALQQ